MRRIFNRLSFFLSVVCGFLVFLFSVDSIGERVLILFGVHPLKMVFYLTLFVILIGFIGFTEIYNWRTALEGIFAVGFSLFLAIFLAYIIFAGAP